MTRLRAYEIGLEYGFGKDVVDAILASMTDPTDEKEFRRICQQELEG